MQDTIDRRIVEILAENARISLKDLSNQVNLSSPSVAERMRRLEERGVIRSFTVDIDPRALGYSFQVLVRVRPLPGRLHLVQEQLRNIPEVCECDKVTGEDCFIARLVLRSIDQLDDILERIAEMAETNTAVVKSQPIPRRLPPLS
ncbi:MAG TPA: Lrp/AsnC family transcriptional regulator [Azospirillaceae bacterium]|nr:Lrp/AsnC family transcriptional regulator [Azospirillaceae bacterium]